MAPLTLEGLAEFFQRHIEDTAARIQAVDRQIHEVDRQIQSLAGQVDALVGLLRDQSLRLTSLAEHQAEEQAQIRQILHCMDQHDGRFVENDRRFDEVLRRLEGHDTYIRHMLDLLERRGRDGGPEPT